MTVLDTRDIVAGLRTLESVAVIPRVASTQLVARRVLHECIENEVSLPQAIIVAGEQFAGRGRNQRTWSSPRGKGIYATTLMSRPVAELPAVPFAIANILTSFLREVFGLDPRIKWPNDILVGGRKIAGVLIEARVQDEQAHLIVGTGVNIEPVEGDDRPNATTISEAAPERFTGIDAATRAFIEFVDERLAHPFIQSEVLEEWRSRTVHQPGDRITCVLGDRTVAGNWLGVDDHGRARLQSGSEIIEVSSGDLMIE